ncbi:hypothetical protein BDV25DRAFT_153041 [Aspergillus avenaceus]|uniref:Methyltransferase type 12 domain-containing protein n=1 Tax=Aspergillus avenaceus TaxID=36643 RepID=A0A5N6TY63_ASPAV|nr:hypothetical protein BDV25DRAFT_153041 [Aspergillus avenaceus]
MGALYALLSKAWQRARKFLARFSSFYSDKEVYLLDRNPLESSRLNAQHKFLVDLIGGSPIHPSIPTENITAVADIATGTGIWLFTLPAALPTTNTLYLHGFDISSAQFPNQTDLKSTHEFHLSIQDIRTRFPPEHRNRYDIIHLRLLAGALKQEDYPRAMQNIYELLKPGGYLQWDDGDTSVFDTAEDPRSPLAVRMQNIISSAVVKLGMCPDAPTLIEHLAREVGFEDTVRYSYTTLDRPYLHDAARTWLVEVLRSLLPKSMVGSGEVADEKTAVDRAESLVGEFEGHCKDILPVVNWHVVVARK